MKSTLTYCFLLLALVLSNPTKAEVISREQAKIPTLQMKCAEVMLQHINDPVDKAKGLGLLAMDYLEYNDPDMARIKYDALLTVCPKIEDKNSAYRYLLKATNVLSPILSEMEKKSIFDQVMQDTAGLSIWNKIALGHLAASRGDYDKSYELLLPIVQIRNEYNWQTLGKLRWIYNRDLEYSVGRIIEKVIADSTFINADTKIEILEKFVAFDPFSFDNGNYQEWIDNNMFQALNRGDIDRAIALNENRYQDFDKAQGLVMILDTLIARGEKEVAKEIYGRFQSDIEKGRMHYYLGRIFLKTTLELDGFKSVEASLSKETNPRSKCYFYNCLADAYFQRNQSIKALSYLDSARHLIDTEVKDEYKIEHYLFLARTYQENNELNLAKDVVKIAQVYTLENLAMELRERGLEHLAIHFAYNGDYESAISMTHKMKNYGPSSPRSSALHEVYQIAMYNGDLAAAILLNDEAAKQLKTIGHNNQKNSSVEYTAINYAYHGKYARSFKVAQEFESNYYPGILYFIKGFKQSYEANENSQLPEEYYRQFLDLLEVEQYYENNYPAYKYLIEIYYSAFYKPSTYDFEADLIQRLERYDFNKEFKSKREANSLYRSLSIPNHRNRMDQLFTEDLILFQLYTHAGETEKLTELVNKAMKKCEKRKYKIQDLVDLLAIEDKFKKYSYWSGGMGF
ncbi:MAG: hypothetical protein GQ574_01755 [Crocinitomix sp.]|nr:hypothetical protein [Crocinitomix sp.]